jgi:hypothetical protein
MSYQLQEISDFLYLLFGIMLVREARPRRGHWVMHATPVLLKSVNIASPESLTLTRIIQ